MRGPDLSSLRGVTPALLTPLTEAGRPDAAGMRRLVDHVIAGGVQGLLPLGSTGETASLDPRSRREVLDLVVEAAAGRVPVICGVAQADLASAQADVAASAGRGAVAALVAPPFYYPMDQPAVLEFYRRVACESAIPILAYNIPQLTKVVVEPGTVGVLAGEGVLAGIKDSSRDFEYFQQVALATRELPDFLLFTGTDTMLLASMVVGASGTICASANIAPDAVERVYRAAAARDIDRARELQDWIVRLVGALRVGTFPAGVKAAAELLGLCGRWAAPPASALDQAGVAGLRDDLVSLGVAVVR